MKKTLVALAALAATSAFAQSSVSIDGSVNYGYSVSQTKGVGVGGWKGDRNAINFRVVEDMGAGNKFSALMQMRFRPETGGNAVQYPNTVAGTQDQLFEQTKFSFDTNYGQLALGRFTNAWGVADLHPLEDSGQTTSGHQAINGRFSGQAQYTSPSFSGVKVWALTAKATSNLYAATAGYDGTWNLSTANLATNAVADTRHRDMAAYGAEYTSGPLYVTAMTMKDLTNVGMTRVGATYDFGSFKLYGSQFNQKDNIAYSTTAAAATSGMAAHKGTEIAVKVPYGAYTGYFGHLTNDKDVDLSKTDGSTKTTKNGWGLEYNFTKRTKVMYFGSQAKNGTANIPNGVLKNGHTTFLGMQHNF